MRWRATAPCRCGRSHPCGGRVLFGGFVTTAAAGVFGSLLEWWSGAGARMAHRPGGWPRSPAAESSFTRAVSPGTEQYQQIRRARDAIAVDVFVGSSPGGEKV